VPDSILDPGKQLAFYIPGIGTPTARHDTLLDGLKEDVRQMFGLGLGRKRADRNATMGGYWA